MMNRFQALSLFTDWAFETQLTSWDIDRYMKAYSHKYEALGALIAAEILENQETMPRDLVLKAEDLTWKPAHF